MREVGDHGVDHGMQRVKGRGPCVQLPYPLAGPFEGVAMLLADGHDEGVTDERHDTTDLERRHRAAMTEAHQREEARLVVDIQLGPVARLDRVLHRQRVQTEHLLDIREVGHGGMVESHPQEPPGFPGGDPASAQAVDHINASIVKSLIRRHRSSIDSRRQSAA